MKESQSNPTSLFADTLVLIKGAGDIASGVAYRLKRSGFPLIMTELPAPRLVRRAVCFGEAVYGGQTIVEGLEARRVEAIAEAQGLAHSDIIPVLVDPPARAVSLVKPRVLVDAIMAKVNTGTSLTDVPLVVALGPGFTAGEDCHAVIETNRGHWLGRVIGRGQAEPNTGTPGNVKGYTVDRVLRAPANGHVVAYANIGDSIEQGQLIAQVDGQEICAPFDGVLRGLVHPEVPVTTGLKIGDLDPRGVVQHCFTLSDKSLAVGGGVLEAILASGVVR
ncbi:selenium-dependent molybdenum cofactor biosynthesis protein YqeB [Chloroflexota bacterium]